MFEKVMCWAQGVLDAIKLYDQSLVSVEDGVVYVEYVRHGFWFYTKRSLSTFP